MCQHKAEIRVLLCNCNPNQCCGWYKVSTTRPLMLRFIDLRFDCLQFGIKHQLNYVMLCTYQQPLFSYQNTTVLSTNTTSAKVHFSKWSFVELMKVFWATKPCRLVDSYRRFGGIYCLNLQGLAVQEWAISWQDINFITARPRDAMWQLFSMPALP